MKKLQCLEEEIAQLEKELSEKRKRVEHIRNCVGRDTLKDGSSRSTMLDPENDFSQVLTNLQAIIDAIPEPIMIINRDLSVAMANRAIWEMAPNLQNDMCPRCYQLTHNRETPCSGAEHPCPVKYVVEFGRPTKVEHVHYDRDGKEIFVEIIAAPIFDSNKEVIHVIETSRDITDRKRNEVEISNQLEFLETLIETIPSPIFYKDSKGVYLGCNSAFGKVLGKSKESIIGTTVYDVAPQDLADKYHAADNALMASREVQIYEANVRFSDDTIHDVVFNKAPFFKSDGSVGGLVGVMVDITEAKRTAKALEESLSRFNSFMDNLPALAFIKDEDGKYIYMNRAVESFYDQTVDQRIGKTDYELWPADIAKAITDNDKKVLETKKVLRTQEIVEHDRSRKYHLVVKFPIAGENFHYLIAGVALDITDWREAEREKEVLQRKLATSHRMEALGTLAGGIAHDFNNILTSILGFVDLALVQTKDRADIQSYLSRVLKASYRAKDLVQQILAFSHQRDIRPTPVLIKPIVEEALKLIRASLPTTIRLEHVLDSEGAALIDQTNLHQIVMNLCTNANYAMAKEGGMLKVSLTAVEISSAEVQHHPDLDEGEYIKLIIEDTGCGISSHDLDHIFEPFYSTKPKDKGSGLGLSVVHGIVKSSRGAIRVDSQVGKGSRFEVYLPKIEIEQRQELSKQEVLPIGDEKILFIDDEIMQTELAQESLGQLGYEVSTFSDSLSALEAFKKNPDFWDIVVTDLTMPGISGDVLGKEIKAIRSDLPIILYTGYSENFDEERAKQHGFAGFILKPLIFRDLAKLIRTTVDS